MATPLPPEIQVQTTTNGELYVLPPRDAGWLRVVGKLALLIGLGLLGVAIYFGLIRTGLLAWAMDRLAGGSKPFDIAKLFDAFFVLPCLFFGFPLLKLGRFLLGGRSTIELTRDKLVITQGAWLLRRRKTYRLNQISKFQVKTARPGETPTGLSELMGALNVKLRGGRLRNITWGYPRPMLQALALHMAERCEEQTGTTLLGEAPHAIGIEHRTLGEDRMAADNGEDSPVETAPRPADAVSQIEYREDGLTITVPPVGISRGSKGMFGFAIVWNLFMAAFTAVVAATGALTDPKAFMFWIIGSLFWAIGIGMAVGAVNAGRKRAILDVVGDTLLVTRQNIFKTRQQEAQRDNIQSIRRDKSGVEVNDVPVLNLQVRLKQGKKIAMISQLSDDELAWIAAELNKALAIEG